MTLISNRRDLLSSQCSLIRTVGSLYLISTHDPTETRIHPSLTLKVLRREQPHQDRIQDN